MPRGDRTGPDGMGPITGRGFGYCNDYPDPGYTKGNRRGGAGFGRGQGGGYGRGFRRGFGFNNRFQTPPNQYYPTPIYSATDEAKFIETEIDYIKNELSTMEKRLAELKKSDEE